MPVYDYRCNKCSQEVEEFHSMALEPVILCGKCGARMVRLISPVASIVKNTNTPCFTRRRKGAFVSTNG
jgi:putative FmdB family regulatory protein